MVSNATWPKELALHNEAHIRPTVAEIDLDAIRANLGELHRLHPATTPCPVIKADAYGHGMIPVAHALESAGVQWFAVALVEEGITLRQAGIQARLLIMGGAYRGGFDKLVRHRLTPVIFSPQHLTDLGAFCGTSRLAYHLKIDTGMTRLGCSPEELSVFLDGAKRYPALELEGMMTHLCNADLEDEAMNALQLERFGDCLIRVFAHGHSPTLMHIANSAGSESRALAQRLHSLRASAKQKNMPRMLLRPGLSLYGVHPYHKISHSHPFRPALRWVTSPVHIRTIPPGTPVSYGGRWTSKRLSKIAVLPVGYADGYPRNLSNQASVLIHGYRAPVVGAVCMDMIMVDVTDLPNVDLHDEVVLLGKQGQDSIDAWELADLANTIPYEIFTGIQSRVPRRYVPRTEDGSFAAHQEWNLTSP